MIHDDKNSRTDTNLMLEDKGMAKEFIFWEGKQFYSKRHRAQNFLGITFYYIKEQRLLSSTLNLIR